MIEIITKAYIVKGFEVESFLIKVTEVNSLIVRKKLEYEQNKIINKLKQMKKQGLIKSIYIPKNRKLKKEINDLVEAKKGIKKSINKIKQISL